MTPINPEVSTFTFDAQPTSQYLGKFPVRAVQINGDPWFVAADVCRALAVCIRSNGSINTNAATAKLDADEKSNIPYVEAKRIGLQLIASRAWGVSLINESGLYKMVMRSDKPQAKQFQDWVTRDVLPTIRKTGQYNVHAAKVAAGEMSLTEMTLKVLEGLQEQLKLEQKKVEEMTPKAEAYDQFLDLEGTYTFTDAAKMLGMQSARALTSRLHITGFIYPKRDASGNIKGWNEVAARHDDGLFSTKVTDDSRGFSYTSMRVTPKGLSYFRELFNVSEAA